MSGPGDRSAGRPVRRRIALSAGAVVTVGAALAFTGCSSTGTSARTAADRKSAAHLTVSGGYLPQPLLTDMAAAYFTVTNPDGTDAELTSVTSPLAAHTTLHTTTGTTMRQVDSLTVPAHGTLALGTGGDHLMLENLTHKPLVGDTVTLTLHFAHATPATTTVTVPVRPTTYRPKG